MRVGSLTVDPVYDGYGDQVARDILHVPGKPDAWDKCGHYVDDAGNIQLICGGYLLRVGDRVVLIDAGLGEYEDEQWHGGRFLDSLRGLGVTAAEVTDVVFTHLHWDHVGWATRNGEIVFSNATYRVHRADWGHFVEGPEADPEMCSSFRSRRAAGDLRRGNDAAARSRRAPRPRPHARVDDLCGVERQRAPPADRGRCTRTQPG